MYELLWTGRADKAFKRLPENVQQRIREATEALRETPRPAGTEKLRGRLEGLYRLRIRRSYRVVYEVDDTNQRITIMNVGSREGIYG